MGVRVRFAPSPTGTLHVGSARTALFNWFFAKHHADGVFVLRIEDTDRARSKPEYVEDIERSLAWLGITADEGPLFQSERDALYQAKAEELLKQGVAQRADNDAIIFPVVPQQIAFDDLIHGTVQFDSSLFKDIVLIKGDGSPAYSFACVVDDADMQISHVIRGDDHISNTPKQLLLYRALGAPEPQYAHIPLIVDADRARLSKRTGATAVTEYREMGFLAEAFANYLALLGWSPGNDVELIHPNEIPAAFDVTRIKRTAAQFDIDKLEWLNGQYLKNAAVDRLAAMLSTRVAARGWTAASAPWVTKAVEVYQDRVKTLGELEDALACFFEDEITYDAAAVEQHLKADGAIERLQQLRERLAALPDWTVPAIEEVARGLVDELGLKLGQVVHPARVALTGRSVSPGIFEVLGLAGRERTLRRFDDAIKGTITIASQEVTHG